MATTTKRAPYAPEEDANDADSDASANPRKKTPRILHQSQQQTQHNITLTRAPISAVHNNTIQLVPRKTDVSSDTSLMTGDEQWHWQWPADDDS